MVNNVIPNGKGIITGGPGGFGEDEATNLSALIRGGALPVELKEVQTSVVGPSLGLDAIQMSLIAGIVGIVLIFVLMLVLYRVMVVAANLALLLYILIVFWVIVAMKGVLTLPGIAGLILSIGYGRGRKRNHICENQRRNPQREIDSCLRCVRI